MVFLHGLAGHCGEWAGTAHSLGVRCRTVLTDQRGHGQSSLHPIDLSREAFADDVATVIDAVGVATAVTLVGQSMGVHTALLAADRHPQLVGHLVMVEGGVGGGGSKALDKVVAAVNAWPRSFGSYEGVRDFFGGDNVAGRAWADGYVKREGRWRPRFDPALVHEIMSPVLMIERWDSWRRLSIPVDVVAVERSTIDAHQLERMCRRPDTQCHTVAGAGRDLHLDQHER